MKKALKVANILSWFSLFYWGIPLVMYILRSLTAFNPAVIAMAVILGSIPLHSYAALQLHRSIRRPEIKLSHNTPAGIRFVGLIALCIGVILFLFGVIVLCYAPQLVQVFKEQKTEIEGVGPMTLPLLRQLGTLCLVLGLVAAVNVILNLRLLRWYYLVHQSDASRRDASGGDAS